MFSFVVVQKWSHVAEVLSTQRAYEYIHTRIVIKSTPCVWWGFWRFEFTLIAVFWACVQDMGSAEDCSDTLGDLYTGKLLCPLVEVSVPGWHIKYRYNMESYLAPLPLPTGGCFASLTPRILSPCWTVLTLCLLASWGFLTPCNVVAWREHILVCAVARE